MCWALRKIGAQSFQDVIFNSCLIHKWCNIKGSIVIKLIASDEPTSNHSKIPFLQNFDFKIVQWASRQSIGRLIRSTWLPLAAPRLFNYDIALEHIGFAAELRCRIGKNGQLELQAGIAQL